jgi:hypothetical protein
MRCLFLSLLIILAPLSGCFGEDSGDDVAPTLSVADVSMATRGQYMTIEVDSNVDWTFNRSAGLFYVDDFGVLRDPLITTFPAEKKSLELLILDSERESVDISVTAGDEFWNATLMLEDSQEMMLVDGRRAYDTIDMLTSSHNNRWCASASVHEGGSAYEAAAEAMAEDMREMGFDFVEVTRYDDDPDQLNVVGYNWGRTNPDEYIVVGGHFDIAYLFTPPGGGTNEGANDDTSGSTVSLEMAQALAKME